MVPYNPKKNHGGKKKVWDFFRSVLNVIFESRTRKTSWIYLLPVSAALLPPAAPWYVEIPYPFAAPGVSDRITAVIRTCFGQLSTLRLHYSSSSVDPSDDLYRWLRVVPRTDWRHGRLGGGREAYLSTEFLLVLLTGLITLVSTSHNDITNS